MRKKQKQSSSQASWSILSEGTSSARVEAHIIRTHVNQMVDAIKKNPKLAELVYKVCGDNFEAIPKHLSKMERSLDRTNYALISMGKDWYRQRLTHEDREKVDLASKYNPTPHPSINKVNGESDMKKSASEIIRNLETRIAKLERVSYKVRARSEDQIETYAGSWGKKNGYIILKDEREVEKYIKRVFNLDLEFKPNRPYGRYFIQKKQIVMAKRWKKKVNVHSLEFDKVWRVNWVDENILEQDVCPCCKRPY